MFRHFLKKLLSDGPHIIFGWLVSKYFWDQINVLTFETVFHGSMLLPFYAHCGNFYNKIFSASVFWWPFSPCWQGDWIYIICKTFCKNIFCEIYPERRLCANIYTMLMYDVKLFELNKKAFKSGQLHLNKHHSKLCTFVVWCSLKHQKIFKRWTFQTTFETLKP